MTDIFVAAPHAAGLDIAMTVGKFEPQVERVNAWR
jgi:hypothetical protein